MSFLNSFNQLLYKIFLCTLVLFFLNSNLSAQCEGTFLKPIASKVFNERVYIQGVNDLTGDGILDLIGYGFEPGSTDISKLFIYKGNIDFTFDAPKTLNLPNPLSVGRENIIDFNFDGKNDILINSGSIFIFLNDGNENFTALPTTSLEPGETYINAADINNDNVIDLLTSSNNLGQGVNSYYRLGNANGTFNSRVSMPFAIYSVAADFNNDGKVDFPTISGSSNNQTLRIYYNQGNGVFLLGNNSVNIGAGNSYLIRANDLNNDGKPDLSLSGIGTILVLMNNGNDNFSKTDYELPIINTNSASYPRLTPGNFNDDNFVDFLLASFDPSFYLILTNDGNGHFTIRQYDRFLSGAPLGDFDNDGKTDFLTINQFNFFNANSNIRIFNETQISIKKNVCNPFGQTKIVDFDGDGKTDKGFWNSNEGTWHYYLENELVETILQWGNAGDIPALGDFDGDGKTDLTVYRPSNGVWYTLNSSDNSYRFTQFGLSSDKPVPSDYDGDGKTDIAVYRPSEGNWYIFLSESQQFSISHFGINEDKPVPEDFDGDGKTDLAIFRPSTATWYYLRSSNSEFSAIKWGITTDIPIPADFDGDGKADLTVYRESEGNWYILRSINNQFTAYHFGQNGDVPQPGDWNGNGIMDLGIYRSANSRWYSSDTSTSAYFNVSGGSPISYIFSNQ